MTELSSCNRLYGPKVKNICHLALCRRDFKGLSTYNMSILQVLVIIIITEHKIKILLRNLLSHIISPLYGILPISIKIEYSSLLNNTNNGNPTMVPVLQLLPNLCHLLYSKIYLLSVSSSHLVLNVFH